MLCLLLAQDHAPSSFCLTWVTRARAELMLVWKCFFAGFTFAMSSSSCVRWCLPFFVPPSLSSSSPFFVCGACCLPLRFFTAWSSSLPLPGVVSLLPPVHTHAWNEI